MPSLILTGHPCTGKSTFAKLLSERATQHKSKLITHTVIINEASARPGLPMEECYANATQEKLTRSALKSEFDRHCNTTGRKDNDTCLVILDSMNYIKGYRYELHCISRSIGIKHGVVWLLLNETTAKHWNKIRLKVSPDDNGNGLNSKNNTQVTTIIDGNETQKEKAENHNNEYIPENLMNELILRYEPPDQRNRWDRPLYRIDVNSTLAQTTDHDETVGKAAEEALNKSVYNMHSLKNAIRDSSQSMISGMSGGNSATKKKVGSGFKRHVSTAKPKVAKTHLGTETASTSAATAKSPDTSKNSKDTDTTKLEVKKMEDLIDELLDSFLLDIQPLKPNQSTKLQGAVASNVLHDVDSISQDVLNAFVSAQKSNIISGGVGTLVIPITPDGGTTCSIQTTKTIQLMELKRLRRQYIRWVRDHPPEDTSLVGIATSFVSYIEDQL